MIILGIDPGTTTTGFAISEKNGNKINLIDYGILKTIPKVGIDLKLLEIGNDIRMLIEKYKPELVSIEKLYFTNNIKTGIDVSHARGVIIYECMKHNLKVLEYTPLEVKKGITGNGKANKIQLQNAIKIIFKLKEIPKPDDAADAIGLSYIGALSNR
nr:crossover junction endodeoxyribonuclease RuvC [Candidatus Gracilibacteria bacterium]